MNTLYNRHIIDLELNLFIPYTDLIRKNLELEHNWELLLNLAILKGSCGNWQVG